MPRRKIVANPPEGADQAAAAPVPI
jgi:hypothetical protein